MTDINPDMELYRTFHDKDAQHFYFQLRGCITHCYRLGPYKSSFHDYHRWWKVLPIPEVQLETLTEVPRDCEIEYQLGELCDSNFPAAGGFHKETSYKRHPRYNQWSGLLELDEKPANWEKSEMTMAGVGIHCPELRPAPLIEPGMAFKTWLATVKLPTRDPMEYDEAYKMIVDNVGVADHDTMSERIQQLGRKLWVVGVDRD